MLPRPASFSYRPLLSGRLNFTTQVKEYRSKGVNPLVAFSGDAYNPSLMSTITMGKQMVAVLNEIGVDISCVGVSA